MDERWKNYTRADLMDQIPRCKVAWADLMDQIPRCKVAWADLMEQIPRCKVAWADLMDQISRCKVAWADLMEQIPRCKVAWADWMYQIPCCKGARADSVDLISSCRISGGTEIAKKNTCNNKLSDYEKELHSSRRHLFRLTNAEFISFMERFMALLPLEDDEEGGQHAPKLGITAELVAEGRAFLASMNDLTLKSQLKAETKPKKEIDRLRDRMLAYIIERIDFSRDALDAAVAAAAEKLYLVAKPYRGAGRLAYNQETVVIKGFLLDMNKTENLDAVQALGIENDLDTEKMRDLRVQMGDWYQEVTSLAFASNVLNESEESLSFMTGLNAVIQDVKTLYKQRIAQSNSGKGETPEPDGEGDGNLEFVPVE